MSPYQAVYGVEPPTICMYMPGSTAVQSADAALQDRDKLIRLLRTNLQLAQNRKRQVTQRIGPVAYRLLLPVDSKIHPVFHVSLLKQKIGDASTSLSALPPLDSTGVFQWLP